jgi:hypothetical protein
MESYSVALGDWAAAVAMLVPSTNHAKNDGRKEMRGIRI